MKLWDNTFQITRAKDFSQETVTISPANPRNKEHVT